MANAATTPYDSFLTVSSSVSVPLTNGKIELDSGTLETPIQTTINPGDSAPTIYVLAANERSEGMITYSADIDGDIRLFQLFFLKSTTEIVASATPKSVDVYLNDNPSEPLQASYNIKYQKQT